MADETERALARQLRAWADHLADGVPAWEPSARPPGRATTAASNRRTRRWLPVAAALLVAAMAVVLWRAAVDDEEGVVADQGDSVSVGYERVLYSQEGDLACPGPSLADQGDFDDAVFEAWADQDGKRWRSRVTYPDGSTRDVIAVGDPWYPDELYSRGDVRGRPLGCADDEVGALLAEPGQGNLFSLNPLAPLPEAPAPGVPAVLTYTEGTLRPGDHQDSEGRDAALWVQEVPGFIGSRPVEQTTEWLVDPDTRVVLEQVYVVDLDGVGTARSTLTLVESGEVTVPGDFLDPAGYDVVDLGGDPSPPTTTGDGASEPAAGDDVVTDPAAVLQRGAFVAATASGDLVAVSPENGSVLTTIISLGDGQVVSSIAIAPDRSTIYVAVEGETIGAGSVLRLVPGAHPETVIGGDHVAVSPDGRRLAVSGRADVGAFVGIVDLESGSSDEVHLPVDGDVAIRRLLWSAAGTIAIEAGGPEEPSQLFMLDPVTGALERLGPPEGLERGTGWITPVDVDDTVLVIEHCCSLDANSYDGGATMLTIDPATGAGAQRRAVPNDVWLLAAGADGRILAMDGSGSRILTLDGSIELTTTIYRAAAW